MKTEWRKLRQQLSPLYRTKASNKFCTVEFYLLYFEIVGTVIKIYHVHYITLIVVLSKLEKYNVI